MYAPLSPILATDSSAAIDAQDVLERIEALAVVLATVATLAGQVRRPAFDALSVRAELSASLAAASPQAISAAGQSLDTLGLELHAGLLALEKAYCAARLNRSAAMLLHSEAATSYHAILAALGYPTAH